MTALRQAVFTSGDSPHGSPEIRACRAEFAALAAPETGEFEPHRENFGVLSLFRISLGLREKGEPECVAFIGVWPNDVDDFVSVAKGLCPILISKNFDVEISENRRGFFLVRRLARRNRSGT